jgi:hypothetical protein
MMMRFAKSILGAVRIFGYYTAYAAPSFIKSAAVFIKKIRM